jgi:hypothetical protein
MKVKQQIRTIIVDDEMGYETKIQISSQEQRIDVSIVTSNPHGTIENRWAEIADEVVNDLISRMFAQE